MKGRYIELCDGSLWHTVPKDYRGRTLGYSLAETYDRNGDLVGCVYMPLDRWRAIRQMQVGRAVDIRLGGLYCKWLEDDAFTAARVKAVEYV